MEKKYKLEIKSYAIKVADSDATAISKPETVFNILKEDFNPLQEEFYLLILDIKNKVIDKTLVAKGGNNTLLITPTEIIRPVLLTNGNRFIVAHNHPSNNPMPSEEDIQFTKKIKKASDIVGITMLDSLIYTSDEFVSLKQMGIIE